MQSIARLTAALLSVAAPAFADGNALPPALERAVLDVHPVAAADRKSYLENLHPQLVDIAGDGKPVYIVETQVEGEGDGQTCTNEVFAGSGETFSEVYRFDCCGYRATAGRAGKGGKLVCPHRVGEGDLHQLVWKGAWPKFERSTTVTEVEAAYLKAEKMPNGPERRELACLHRKLEGDVDPKYVNACAGSLLVLGAADEAFSEVSEALDKHPRDATLHLMMGAICEVRHDAGKAIESYKRYLALSPGASEERSFVEGRLAKLRPAQP